MPTIGAVLIFTVNPAFNLFVPDNSKIIVYLITLGFTFLLPVLNAMFLLRNGYIQNFKLETRKERTLPFLITAIFFFAHYYLINGTGLPRDFKLFILGVTLTAVIALLINLFWKISVHMMGIGGVTGAMLALSYKKILDMGLVIIILFLCAGLIGFARLKLKTHSHGQVYTGFILGLLAEFILLMFF